MWGSIDGLQSLVEGAHVTHVSIPLCPLGKSCPPIILHGPELSLECTAGSVVSSLGSLVIRFCKQMIVSGAFFFFFRAALGFPYLLRQTSLGVFLSTGQQLQPWFPVLWSSSASTVPQALQLSHSYVFPPTWLEDCFSPLDYKVCALAVSSPGDLSSWKETWRQRRLCSLLAYDQCSSLLHCWLFSFELVWNWLEDNSKSLCLWNTKVHALKMCTHACGLYK